MGYQPYKHTGHSSAKRTTRTPGHGLRITSDSSERILRGKIIETEIRVRHMLKVRRSDSCNRC